MHRSVLQTVGQRVGAQLRKRLFSRIMNQEVAFFENNRAGELANRLSTDVHEVSHAIQISTRPLSTLFATFCAPVNFTMLTFLRRPLRLLST
jgi:ABC-type multidrug transport system fused ATPase/permease subunit